MVKSLFKFLGKEIGGLHEAAYLLGFFALLSQVLALVRDRFLAHTFGAGTTLDLYYAAFRVPDFIFAVIASFFSASILIPFLSAKMREGTHHGREFLSVMFSIFLIVILVVSAVTFFLIPFFIDDLFPGFSAEPYRSQIILLTRILLLSPIFLGLSNLFASVTQFYNRFFIYGISPLLYNLGIIFGIVELAPHMGPVGLVWGVVIGAMLHFVVQVPFVSSRSLVPKFMISAQKFKDVVGVMLVGFPRTFALSAQELSRFFLVSLASLMNVGSIAIFSLSYNLQSVPLSIIGVSYSMAAFPTLSNLFASGDRGRFSELLQTTGRYIIFFSLPLIALFIVLRAHIVRVVLGSGEFSWQDTRLTAAALSLFVISLAAQGLTLLFTRARYAEGNTRKPFVINIASTIVTIIGASLLAKLFVAFPGFQVFIEMLFRVQGVPGTAVLMLPLAFSIGNILGALLHVYTFEQDYGDMAKVLTRVMAQVTGVSVVMGVVAYVTLNLISPYVTLNSFIGVLSQGAIAGFMGLISGILLLAVMGNRELKEVSVALHRKFLKTPVVGPDPVDL